MTNEATTIEETRFGQTFEINRELIDPNGYSLPVTTIWMIEPENNISKFITMFPYKNRNLFN